MPKTIILFDNLDEACNMIQHRAMRSIVLEGQKYGLVRYQKDFYLFEAYCPHQQYSLIQDQIGPNPEIICGWHSYRFALNNGVENQMRCENLKIQKLQLNDKLELIAKL